MGKYLQSHEMWDQLVERHGWVDDEQIVKLKVRGLRNLLEQAWNEGNAVRGELESKNKPEPDTNPDNPFKGMFDGFL